MWVVSETNGEVPEADAVLPGLIISDPSEKHGVPGNLITCPPERGATAWIESASPLLRCGRVDVGSVRDKRQSSRDGYDFCHIASANRHGAPSNLIAFTLRDRVQPPVGVRQLVR